MHRGARISCNRAHARFMASARVYNSCARIYAPIFMKFFLVVSQCLINLSFKFRKDPSFRCGDISLFVTVYDFELKILSFLKPKKNAILNVKLRFFLDTICLILLHRSGTQAVGEQKKKTVCKSDKN